MAAGELASAAGLEARGAVIWGASGFSDRALGRLGAALPALSPVASGQVADGRRASSRPGSAVAAVFVDGDLRLAATGTVTERTGDRMLAFGHPVVGLGEVSLPLAPAEIIAVLPSQFSSFKISNSGPVRGAFVRDHAAGTLGRVGAVPSTVPFEIRVEGETGRSFDLRLARVPQFLPLLAAIGGARSGGRRRVGGRLTRGRPRARGATSAPAARSSWRRASTARQRRSTRCASSTPCSTSCCATTSRRSSSPGCARRWCPGASRASPGW